MSDHELYFDLTTPRQFTQHGGWNKRCECGVVVCSHVEHCDCYDQHLKEMGA